jgi:hypothetical protein
MPTKKKRISRKKKVDVALADMMKDPEYFYVKGAGWIPCLEPPPPTMWADIGKYRVTIINRRPKLGEKFLTEYPTEEHTILENCMLVLQDDYWSEVFTNNSMEDLENDHFSHWDQYCERSYTKNYSNLVVVNFEPLQ